MAKVASNHSGGIAMQRSSSLVIRGRNPIITGLLVRLPEGSNKSAICGSNFLRGALNRRTKRGKAVSQFYINSEKDMQQCRESIVSRRAITISGLTGQGKVSTFSGFVQSIEDGHSIYPDYPWRVTMLDE